MAVDQLLPVPANSKKKLHLLQNAPGLNPKTITPISQHGLLHFLQSIVLKTSDKPFYTFDLAVVATLFDLWSHSLPTVRPFYAVKCNPNPDFLAAMAALGSNFDCASRAEIQSVLALGVSPDRIVFANPCKPESHIEFAATVGVNLTTFDSVDEIQKIRRCHPKSALLIRIKPSDDGSARCPLGNKYGALPEEIIPLLQAAKSAELAVVGVSFHIGSGATETRAYSAAIAAARGVFETAVRLGLPPMNVLNIGGGFTAGPQFEEAAVAVKSAIKEYFPEDLNIALMAEPGRFFAESAFTLAVHIIGKRVRGDLREYWINDGIYGSMNCILYDHATLSCRALAVKSNMENPTCGGGRMHRSTVFGPTCDALDTVLTGKQLPELEVGDWLVFPKMGAYTAAAGSNFNGFNTAAIETYIVYSEQGNGAVFE
ncbi:ornithine decarboxylase-like [Cucumis melo var. makuwa]|uniref:ornithine decarboxylase n=1 Tax=Cucumis melo var. makuwa TaxID=1194695 RepID=A0A5A7VEV5_CUCMM|nr:ornithine decarboxylase-like [Cucumis melo var. makuwa]